MDTFIHKGSVGVKVNDDIGQFFQTHKGLGQGDSMSPVLFNIVADMLTILIDRAKEKGQIGGLIPNLIDGGVSVLQYADDTIIFMEHDMVKARNMKLLLCLFEQLSGLKINFNNQSVTIAFNIKYYSGITQDACRRIFVLYLVCIPPCTLFCFTIP